jgi:putative thioredoxin
MTLLDPTADDRGPAPKTSHLPASIVELSVANFEREALARSREMPVLIDFWATWCAPCRTLTPILEKLAAEHAGRFVLAKVDIDRERELAEAFRIQSVPTVVLLVRGRPVDAFMGAQPEKAVRAFLEPHLGPAQASAVEQADRLVNEGRDEEALALLSSWTARHPQDGPALIALARLHAERGELGAAEAVRVSIPPEALESDAGRALVALLSLQAGAGDVERLAAAAAQAPDDLAAQLAWGRALVAEGRVDEGLEVLWQAARTDLAFDGGAPRRALLEVFGVLGFDDPRTIEYQRRLSMLLTA